jgi:hypothetical protein
MTETRRYTSGTHSFEVLLSRRVLKDQPVWMVERVLDTHAGKFIVIRGMQAVTAPTPDVTFARACDCIDKWLWVSPSGQ